MSRKTALALALVLLIGLATAYLHWGGRHHGAERKTDDVTSTPMGGADADAGLAEALALDAGTRHEADGVALQTGNAQGGVVAVALGTAVIEGEVRFTGAMPAPGKLHREADPYCAREPMTDPTVLVANGKLANVWVHVIKGAPNAVPPATAAVVSQRDCMYAPRVTTAVVGQKIVTRNDDPILHNVHAYLLDSTLFNKGMPNEKAAPIEFTTAQSGVIKLKCDVHPWMRGYVGVSPNDFQDVTGSDGLFRIPHLAAGPYTLEAWHEKLGAKAIEVTAPGRVIFTYDGTER